MKKGFTLAITGTRGVPNNYGGFEQFAQHLAVDLARRGHEVVVYNPHFHPYREDRYEGVRIVHKWCPENLLGSAAHYIYDLLCIRDAARRGVDVILECGYTSAAPAFVLVRKRAAALVLNSDGVEWRRTKWGPVSGRLVHAAERICVHRSDRLVADNEGIRTYLRQAYGLDSVTIPYGTALLPAPDAHCLDGFGLVSDGYYMALARLEPENNFEMILAGYLASASEKPFCVVGNHATRYGEFLKKRFAGSRVRFLGAIYDQPVVHALRHFSALYFHGHSVGGTNPSLLDAMASEALICAHDNEFNRSVTGACALYFSNAGEVTRLIESESDNAALRAGFARGNLEKVRGMYSWKHVADAYEALLAGTAARR